MRQRWNARTTFIVLWVAISLLKLGVAIHLPLFVDEAFYWQESRHLAMAYSDLPGLTAWLIRIGNTLFGDSPIALRLPFLIIAACVPWLVVRITAREFDIRHAWLAGIATMLLPLAGTLGLLALPDAAMALATLLCVDAGARLLRRISDEAVLELALGLAIGALSHYRFIAVIGVGFVVLLALPRGRKLLPDPRVWIAIAFGIAAWVPLMAWNFDNAEAGLRFQLVDRHPWAFHADGILFLAIQALLVTPLLFGALIAAGVFSRHSASEGRRYLAWLGLLVVAGFFALGFFADTQRVSFHWPLPGYLALLPALPALLDRWPVWWRRLTWLAASFGLIAALGYFAFVSSPSLRAESSALKWYPSNFAGWSQLADAVRKQRAAMPAGTRIVADNFKIGAELGFALSDPEIRVLDHPLNREHGRAPQLALWGLLSNGRDDLAKSPVLLVVGASDVEYRNLLQRYHTLCARVGPLPRPRILNIDHGRTRYLLFAFDSAARDGVCKAPAMAWFDRPAPESRVGRTFDVAGWSFKDGVGIAKVEVTLDDRLLTTANYGKPAPYVAAFWKISNDPAHPNVAFDARVTLPAAVRGHHWLGLTLHGKDGSIERWPQQRIRVEPDAEH